MIEKKESDSKSMLIFIWPLWNRIKFNDAEMNLFHKKVIGAIHKKCAKVAKKKRGKTALKLMMIIT